MMRFVKMLLHDDTDKFLKILSDCCLRHHSIHFCHNYSGAQKDRLSQYLRTDYHITSSDFRLSLSNNLCKENQLLAMIFIRGY